MLSVALFTRTFALEGSAPDADPWSVSSVDAVVKAVSSSLCPLGGVPGASPASLPTTG